MKPHRESDEYDNLLCPICGYCMNGFDDEVVRCPECGAQYPRTLLVDLRKEESDEHHTDVVVSAGGVFLLLASGVCAFCCLDVIADSRFALAIPAIGAALFAYACWRYARRPARDRRWKSLWTFNLLTLAFYAAAALGVFVWYCAKTWLDTRLPDNGVLQTATAWGLGLVALVCTMFLASPLIRVWLRAYCRAVDPFLEEKAGTGREESP